MKYTAIATNGANVIGINKEVGHRFICYSKTPSSDALALARDLKIPYIGQLKRTAATV